MLEQQFVTLGMQVWHSALGNGQTPEHSGDLVPVQDGFDAQCLVLQLQPAVHGAGTASDSKMASKNVILCVTLPP